MLPLAPPRGEGWGEGLFPSGPLASARPRPASTVAPIKTVAVIAKMNAGARAMAVCSLLRTGECPAFVEKPRLHDPAGGPGCDRRVHINHRKIGELGHLPGIVQIVVLAEGETAVQHD